MDVATQALRKWNFPAEIVEAVKYHHGLPDAGDFRSDHRTLCETIRAADALARATGIGRGGGRSVEVYGGHCAARVCASPSCTAPGQHASVAEPYDRDALLQILSPPADAAEAKSA